MTLRPTISFRYGSRVELTLSIYRRWNNADCNTYRYVSLWFCLPFVFGFGRLRYNRPRFGRHVDRFGRIYYYFGVVGGYQDVRPADGNNDYKPCVKLLGCEFIWN